MISGAVSLNYLMIMGGILDSLSPRSLLAHPLLKRSARGGNSRANKPFAHLVSVHVNTPFMCFLPSEKEADCVSVNVCPGAKGEG